MPVNTQSFIELLMEQLINHQLELSVGSEFLLGFSHRVTE